MDLPDIVGLTKLIKERSASAGFDLTGIARARRMPEYGRVLEEWCSSGMHDTMNFLVRDISKRSDPSLLFPGIKTLIVTGLNYYAEMKQESPGVPLISRYAYGKDYHAVITEKLEELLGYIKALVPGVEGRPFVDSAPLLEKPWAVEAGLGWQGRHSIVINREKGSFFFIGILALNIELDYDKPYAGENCGDCRLCIEMCPTHAINENKTIDARKCISNLTIENRGPIPDDILPLMGGRVYACDRCQEVCPWNRNSVEHSHSELKIKDEVAMMTVEDWASLREEKFTKLFSDTPVGRVKYERFKTNIDAVLKSMRSQI